MNDDAADITLVITSCGRWDLLNSTLLSLFRYADLPFAATIITEDSGHKMPLNPAHYGDPGLVTIIDERPRVGQIASVDRAYALVNTPYIFHCEDDWEFHRAGFLRESLEVLAQDPKCINHWLRGRNDTNGHPVDGDRVRAGHGRGWYGFSFNPTLKRLSDYRLIGTYGTVSAWDPRDPGSAECAIGQRYHQLGYHTTIARQGYVRHIGEGRHTR
jgi:hypothetical protein